MGCRQILLFLLLVASIRPVAVVAAPQTQELLKRGEVIWSFAYLPDGKILLTERSVKLLRFDPATRTTQDISGVPPVAVRGQGGLMDVALHPDFKKNSVVYLTLSAPDKNGATTALVRARLQGDGLTEVKEIFRAQPANTESIHFGSRIAFDSQGKLWLTMGERNDRDKAQDLTSHLGKVLRLNDDGTPAPGNPFLGQKNAMPEIWSYGHRNPQGIAIDQKTQNVYVIEHGPRGGDEVNLVLAGKNYGWPVITYGREYWGPKIGEGTAKVGMEQPLKYWVPSIAPSDLMIYTGERFPAWKGSFFAGALAKTHLNRFTIDGGKPKSEERLFEKQRWRIRCVRQTPAGGIAFSTDDGRLIEIVSI